MRLIISGCRHFNDYEFVKNKVNICLKNIKEDITILSGACRGVDKLGEKYALEKGYLLEQYPAEWNLYGNKAGIVRNSVMAANATHCICFWDGKSKGTFNMIDTARKKGLKLRVINI